MSARKKVSKTPKKGAATNKKVSGSSAILAWLDDPGSGLKTIQRPVPDPNAAPLPFAIQEPRPDAKIYKTGTSQFRYWTAAEALRRTANFWGSRVPPGTTWHGPVSALGVTLDAGEDLNAYYSRTQALRFFHGGQPTVYSGESPDVVCHEMGHAVLDAIRPELWNSSSHEIAAFHESFGDMSALLSALQLQPVRAAVLKVTGGKLFRSSQLSRLAEQLAEAIRGIRPDLVERDCLRNAVNSFVYQRPETLPVNGPATMLSSEPHSFSRVFTGAFYSMLSNMLVVEGKDKPNDQHLLQISADAGTLLIAAIINAPPAANYYSQVAGHMLEADKRLFSGKYVEAISAGFTRFGILALDSASMVRGAQTQAVRTERGMSPDVQGEVSWAAGTAARQQFKKPEAVTAIVAGEQFGLPGEKLVLEIPVESPRFEALSAVSFAATADNSTAEDSVKDFLKALLIRGRVSFPAKEKSLVPHLNIRKSHELVRTPEGLVLSRNFFDCGFD